MEFGLRLTLRVFSNCDMMRVIIPSAEMNDRRESTWLGPGPGRGSVVMVRVRVRVQVRAGVRVKVSARVRARVSAGRRESTAPVSHRSAPS